jgi:hypothetical protein
MHLSVRPTTMAVIPPGFSYTLRSSAGDCQDGSIANTPSVNPTSVQKKRKRQVLDYILMPPLPKAIQLTIANTKKTRKHSTSQTKGRAKQKEQDGNLPMDVEMVYPISPFNVCHSLSCLIRFTLVAAIKLSPYGAGARPNRCATFVGPTSEESAQENRFQGFVEACCRVFTREYA